MEILLIAAGIMVMVIFVVAIIWFCMSFASTEQYVQKKNEEYRKYKNEPNRSASRPSRPSGSKSSSTTSGYDAPAYDPLYDDDGPIILPLVVPLMDSDVHRDTKAHEKHEHVEPVNETPHHPAPEAHRDVVPEVTQDTWSSHSASIGDSHYDSGTSHSSSSDYSSYDSGSSYDSSTDCGGCDGGGGGGGGGD